LIIRKIHDRIQKTEYRKQDTESQVQLGNEGHILEESIEMIARAYRRNERAGEQDRQNRYTEDQGQDRQAYRRKGGARDRTGKTFIRGASGQDNQGFQQKRQRESKNTGEGRTEQPGGRHDVAARTE
jgi:hypothetical protein